MWNFIRKSFKRELLVSFVAVALLPLILSCIFLIQMFKVKLERDYQKKDLEQAAVMEEKLTTLFQTIDDVTLHLSKEPEIAASIRESGNRGRSAVYAKLYEETASLREMASQLRYASQRGLVERFDATIGAGSLLMPFGGRNQATPTQAMAAKLPVLPGEQTDAASVMAWGCDPELLSADPFVGAQMSVISSMAKIVAAGADYKKAYLTLQEFFEKLRNDPERWGKPFEALLGALTAQLSLDAAAIGGKDSMSGTFLDKDVPPTVISFAIAPLKAQEVISNEFKEGGHSVYCFGSDGTYEGLKDTWERFHGLCQAGQVKAAWAVDAVKWAVGSGLVNGVEGNALAPQGTSTRAQAATVLMRFVG